MNTSPGLKIRDHRKQIFSLRITFLAEHAHKAFSRGIYRLTEAFKADCGVNIVAQ